MLRSASSVVLLQYLHGTTRGKRFENNFFFCSNYTLKRPISVPYSTTMMNSVRGPLFRTMYVYATGATMMGHIVFVLQRVPVVVVDLNAPHWTHFDELLYDNF